MKNYSSGFLTKHGVVVAGVFILLIVGCGIGVIAYTSTKAKNIILSSKVSELEEALKNLDDSLTRIQKEKDDLVNALNSAGEKNQSFANQIDKINVDLESFQRLSQIDPELLQKYSKVYFLSENYVPSSLTDIDTKYLFTPAKTLQIHDRVWPFLNNLIAEASRNEIDIKVVSAYRSFGTQASLKSNYKVTYGAGTANSFSADQGYSEHQLGSAIDFTTTKTGGGLTGFEKTTAYEWLLANAYKYGFILSYPTKNNYYVYEPWHWRFVGLDLALRLHNENKNFYDLDQRDISTYLRLLFNGIISSTTDKPLNKSLQIYRI